MQRLIEVAPRPPSLAEQALLKPEREAADDDDDEVR